MCEQTAHPRDFHELSSRGIDPEVREQTPPIGVHRRDVGLDRGRLPEATPEPAGRTLDERQPIR